LKNLNNLHVTASGSMIGIGWTLDNGQREHVWLATYQSGKYEDANNGYAPERPFRVKREYCSRDNAFTGSMTLYRNPPLNSDGKPLGRYDDGYFQTRHLNAEAAANKDRVAEALRIAERDGMFEAAVKTDIEQRERAERARNERFAASIREHLSTREFSDPEAAIIASKLHACDDAVLIDLAYAFRMADHR
jgi:hypothetical protein